MKRLFFIIIILFASKLYAQENETAKHKLFQVIDNITTSYVDTVNIDKVVNKGIIAILKELDPHSIFIDKKDVEKINQPLEGSFDGIGIEYSMLDDTLYVISTIPTSPANKNGIQAGDRILKINNENIAGVKIQLDDIKKRLMGQKGSEIVVTILRKEKNELIEITLHRDKIPIFSVEAAYMVGQDIGYIKIVRFSATTLNEFRKAYSKLAKKGATKIILDLRENGGGFLNAAIDLADEFLEENKMIVYTEGLNSMRAEYRSSKTGYFEKGKLIILIDEGSASASEIVTGAVQDWDRGIVIGRRSFGKGLVQRPFYLVDGSLIRLTIARYYTPTGRLIQKSYQKGVKDYSFEVQNRMMKGELTHPDSIKFPDSLKFYTLSAKRLVYGGGGIMPDIFVPIDTIKAPLFYQDWIKKGYVNNYMLSYVDKNRKQLMQTFSDFQKFKNEFFINDDFLMKLEAYASTQDQIALKNSKKVITNDKKKNDYGFAKNLIKNQLKALLARDLWSNNEYHQINNDYNQTVKKAIEVFRSQNLYEAKLNQ